MSLVTSANAGSNAGSNYFINASYMPGGAQQIVTGEADGAIRIEPATTGVTAGTAFIRGGLNAVSLTLGANDVTNSQIGLSGAGVQVYTPLVVGTSISVNNALSAAPGATPAAASLDTFTNRDIHGFADTGYVVAFSAPQGSGPIPNPVALPNGLYSVIASAPGDGNIGAQVSAMCYWTGAQWIGSGVSTTFTTGTPNCAILPVAGSGQLSLGGVAVPANTVVAFRQLLADPNL